jgi:hypothetical protein
MKVGQEDWSLAHWCIWVSCDSLKDNFYYIFLFVIEFCFVVYPSRRRFNGILSCRDTRSWFAAAAAVSLSEGTSVATIKGTSVRL